MRARVQRPQKHENLTFYEISKKSKNRFLDIFEILVIFEFFLVLREKGEILRFLSFFIILVFYVFKLLFKHFWTPGTFWKKIRKFSFFEVFVPKNLKT